jgi:hypothetical protein
MQIQEEQEARKIARRKAMAPAGTVQWEYLTKSSPNAKTLRKLGEQGWELVSTTPHVSSMLGFGGTDWVTYQFRRRLP